MPAIEDYDITQLIKGNLILSIFSFFGSACIILLFTVNKNLNSFVFSLVFYLAISELMNSIGNILSFDRIYQTRDKGSVLCTIQGVIINYTDMCSLLWTSIINYTIYDLIKNCNHAVEKKKSLFLIIGYTVPALFTLIPILLMIINDDDWTNDNHSPLIISRCWCWISGMNKYRTFVIVQYVILWLLILYNFIVIFIVIRFMKQSISEESTVNWKIRAMCNKLYNYPIFASFCWIFATVHRGYQIYYDDGARMPTVEEHRWEIVLNLLHGLFMCFRGFCYFIIYGLDEKVQIELKKIANKIFVCAVKKQIYQIDDHPD